MADPVRVLWLIKGLGPGGAERLLVDAAVHVDRTRFSYSAAYLLPWKDHLVADLEGEGVPVTCLGQRRGADPTWVLRLRRLIARERIDLVHVHSPVAAIGARVGLTGADRPAIVTTEHNVWSRYRPLTRRLNAWTFGRQDAVIAVSEEVRRSMGHPEGPPVSVIANGVDRVSLAHSLLSRDDARAQLGLPADAPVVGTIGSLTPKKGHLTLIAAARTVRAAVPGARFVIIGLPVEDVPLRAAIRDAGLEGVVILTGYREHAAQVLSAFDVFCLPSLFEGMPVALLEAMALGLPCVATLVGGVPEVAIDGESALLVPPADPASLASALLRLLSDAPLRGSLGEGAARRAKGFDIATLVRRTEALYDDVLDGRRG